MKSLSVIGVLGLCLASSAPAAEPSARAVVHLRNGSFLPGEPRGSADAQILRWESPAFGRTLEFPLGAVKAVHYPGTAKPPKTVGKFAFEFGNDDTIYGDLVGWTDTDLEIESQKLGRVQVRRDQVRRIARRSDADSVYLGPNGLAGWNSKALTKWRDEGGHISTDQPRAVIASDPGIPEKAVIELEISWKSKPDFVFAVGVSDRADSIKNAFRLEVWDGQLVAVGESQRDADIAIIQPANPAGGQCRIQMLLDQKERRLVLMSRNGRPLATLQIADKKPVVGSGVRLTNLKGDVRLEFLRVGKWNGVAPRDVPDHPARVLRKDGASVSGQSVRYDAQARHFAIRNGDSESIVANEAVSDIYFAGSARSALAAKESSAGTTLRVVYRDGSRFSGDIVRIDDDHVTLNCAGFPAAVRLPLTDVQALIVLDGADRPNEPVVEGKSGRLELDGASMAGRLVDGGDQRDAGLLVWRPDLSRNASPLRPGLSGRIVYRDPPPAKPKKPAAELEEPPRKPINIWSSKPAEPSPGGRPSLPVRAGQPSLYLRTGDTIPCDVTRIDERGVSFQTTQTDTTFLTNDQVKSVELITTKNGPSLEETKRDRLLTLPRAQKDSPPTHLICSKNGDILRGRIVEMDDARLVVEIRLERKEIPRDRVAQIIWLHPDELKDPKNVDSPGAASDRTRVQVVNATGNRLTFLLESSDGRSVTGKSEALGQCRADLAEADQLLFGSFIEMSVAQLAYHSWRLHHAIEPIFAQDDGGGDGGSSGTESSLVGKPAPQVQLDLLGGGKFKLADLKGRVVILDFWATWCGPCVQAMPQVDELARQFADAGVELIAVNMEEQPEAIKSMLERHKLNVKVALDRDGAAAGKYAVTAIPQTVVIDRNGTVARLFVGGGKNTMEGLKKALEELTAK